MYVTLKRKLFGRTTTHLRCISWTLQTSLDKHIHLTALKYLATTELTGLDPILVADCFDAFVGCLSVGIRRVEVVQGLEELVTVSAAFFLRTFQCLRAMDPTSNFLADLRRRFDATFLYNNSAGIPFIHTMTAFISTQWEDPDIWLYNYKPSSQEEHVSLARCMVEAAWLGHQKTGCRKVPRWILRFALHSLSLDPPSPASVVADCLTVIAIDLGCVLPSKILTLDGRYV